MLDLDETSLKMVTLFKSEGRFPCRDFCDSTSLETEEFAFGLIIIEKLLRSAEI